MHLGRAPVPAPQWQVVSQTLHAWGAGQHRQASDLGVRVTFQASRPITGDSAPDCDFAVPLR